MTQDELDSVIAQRLEWASRCASAFSHEVGNIVLFADAAAPERQDSDETNPQTVLLQHFQQLLQTLSTWRHIDQDPRSTMSIAEWWRMQGGMLRQFVRRGVTVTIDRSIPEAPEFDAHLLTRLTAALLFAIEMQVSTLERLSLHPTVEKGESRLCLAIRIAPNFSGASLLLPSLVKSRINADEGHADLAIDEGDAILVLRLDSASQKTGV